MLEKLRELGIRDDLIREITEYRETYPVEQEYGSRIPKLEQFYYGKEVWEQAITANMDAASLIGMDTFRGGEVPQFCVERIFCWQVRKQRERVCLQRIWREYLQDHGGMCRFM